jgi:hypothetical protein
MAWRPQSSPQGADLCIGQVRGQPPHAAGQGHGLVSQGLDQAPRHLCPRLFLHALGRKVRKGKARQHQRPCMLSRTLAEPGQQQNKVIGPAFTADGEVAGCQSHRFLPVVVV